MINKSALLMIAGAVLTGYSFQADAASIYRKYAHYNVTGNTAEQLDRSLSENGPYLESTGQRHPGASRIAFDAKIHYGREEGETCKVTDAKVNIHAKIFIPRWNERKKAEADLVFIWDTLAADIKRHEESHVVIARVHASELEQQAKKLHGRKNCDDLRQDIDKLTEKIMTPLEKEQAYFDKVQAINFEDRFERLLTYRLERAFANTNTNAKH